MKNKKWKEKNKKKKDAASCPVGRGAAPFPQNAFVFGAFPFTPSTGALFFLAGWANAFYYQVKYPWYAVRSIQ